MTESPKISRNYIISGYSDHSRLLDMPFTLLVTSMTRPTALYWLKTWLEKLWQWLSKTDSRLMTRDSTRDSAPGKSNDLRLDLRLGTCDSGLDLRLDSHDSCTALRRSIDNDRFRCCWSGLHWWNVNGKEEWPEDWSLGNASAAQECFWTITAKFLILMAAIW